ncbi:MULTISPECIES: TetR/AcrR family transcriptional regulator [Arenibacter]|uniref:TetR/AcrR family transcriptional regulator n=1 Tax=Arenibacter TaxID=178469 RepID=UPI001C076499|nr:MULTISPECIES: TetR/AcrR family transcriptional regulator [Arenibacter]MBU2906742.1 TetR/AcrR family transcriptional regulator [Arenibacter algicola]MCK0133330.1 TetR/AcrR family transcriptional regulator [Arenibacter sp. S6351L]
MKDQSTEENILKAAISVFQKKGMAGARMQEIADEAKINKAMLHYYYKSKQKLFEAVFRQAFEKFAPHINQVFNSDKTVFEKITEFTDSYISFVMENPYLPNFLIQEINNNPEFSDLFFGSEIAPNPARFKKQIAQEIEMGIIKPIDPKQLLLNLFSLTAFSFVGTGLVRGILDLDEKTFKSMMQERKILIPELLINSIKK